MEKSCHILSIYIVEKKKSWLIPHHPSGLIRKLPERVIDYGTKVFQSSALDAFPIRTEHGRIEGVLYVLPFRTQFSVRNSHKVYLKRMLLSEDDCNLLPSWAFLFVAW